MRTTALAPYRLSCAPSDPRPHELFSAVRADSGSLADSAAALAVLAAIASPPVLMTLALAEVILR